MTKLRPDAMTKWHTERIIRRLRTTSESDLSAGRGRGLSGDRPGADTHESRGRKADKRVGRKITSYRGAVEGRGADEPGRGESKGKKPPRQSRQKDKAAERLKCSLL